MKMTDIKETVLPSAPLEGGPVLCAKGKPEENYFFSLENHIVRL